MSSDLIEKLSGSLEQKLIYNQHRLKAIQNIMEAMKVLNKKYLKAYERHQTWQKVNMGLMKHNMQPSLQNLVQLKVCQASKPQKSYFNPFSKKPITICYNKFIDQDKFNQALSYNMILMYDSKTRKNMNWNKLQDVILTNVRAIHLSGVCKIILDDRQCIAEQLEKRVFTKQRFKNKTVENLSQIILDGLQDHTPISQIILQQK